MSLSQGEDFRLKLDVFRKADAALRRIKTPLQDVSISAALDAVRVLQGADRGRADDFRASADEMSKEIKAAATGLKDAYERYKLGLERLRADPRFGKGLSTLEPVLTRKMTYWQRRPANETIGHDTTSSTTHYFSRGSTTSSTWSSDISELMGSLSRAGLQDVSDQLVRDRSVTYVSDAVQVLQDVLTAVRDRASQAKAQLGTYDINKPPSMDLFVGLLSGVSSTSTPVLQQLFSDGNEPSAAVITTFEDAVGVQRLYSRLGGPLAQLAGSISSVLEELQADLGSDPSNPAVAEIPKVRETLAALPRALLGGGATDAAPPREIEDAFNGMNRLGALLPKVGSSSDSGSAAASNAGKRRPGVDGVAAGGAPGFLYRRPDRARMVRYRMLLTQHLEAVRAHRIVFRVQTLAAGLKDRLNELDARHQQQASGPSPQSVALRTTLADAKSAQLLGFAARVSKLAGDYVRGQLRFMTHRHRDAMEYMGYWGAHRAALSDDAAGEVKDYDARRTDLVIAVRHAMMTVRKEVFDAYRAAVTTGVNMTPQQNTGVDHVYDQLREDLDAQEMRLINLYARGGPSMSDDLLDPQVMLLYALKGARALGAYLALRVAGSWFQKVYDRQVYGYGPSSRDGRPPSPLLFLGMFLAIDMAITLGVVAVLLGLRALLRGEDTFPIDDDLLRAWATDVLASTVIIASLGAAIGTVIHNKKYFRYRYEGDRGVRAMQTMLLYVTLIVLVVPFYRLAFS